MDAMTETVETYNGWKNYPTWAVNLWLSNDEGLYSETLEKARFASKQADPRNGLASSLKFWILEEMPIQVDNGEGGTMDTETLTGFHADLLGYAFDCVDWHEIAASWLEDLEDEDEDES